MTASGVCVSRGARRDLGGQRWRQRQRADGQRPARGRAEQLVQKQLGVHLLRSPQSHHCIRARNQWEHHATGAPPVPRRARLQRGASSLPRPTPTLQLRGACTHGEVSVEVVGLKLQRHLQLADGLQRPPQLRTTRTTKQCWASLPLLERNPRGACVLPLAVVLAVLLPRAATGRPKQPVAARAPGPQTPARKSQRLPPTSMSIPPSLPSPFAGSARTRRGAPASSAPAASPAGVSAPAPHKRWRRARHQPHAHTGTTRASPLHPSSNSPPPSPLTARDDMDDTTRQGARL